MPVLDLQDSEKQHIYSFFSLLSFWSRERFHFRSIHQWHSVKKGVLKNFAKVTGKHLCQSLFFKEACNFIKK